MARYMNRGHLLNILTALEHADRDCIDFLRYYEGCQTAIVAYGDEWYNLWDNGGEIGVENLTRNTVAFAPMTEFETPLNALTMAYRIKQLFKENEIDYDFKYDNEESEKFLKTQGRTEQMYEHFSQIEIDTSQKTIAEKSSEILESTDNGKELDSLDIKLIQLASDDCLNAKGIEMFDNLYKQVMLGEYHRPYLHGIEFMTADEEGHYCFKDTPIGYMGEIWGYDTDEKRYLSQVQSRCLFLEEKGIEISDYNLFHMSEELEQEYAERFENQDLEVEDEDEAEM